MKFLWENATKLVNKEYLSVKICSRLYGVVSATSVYVSSAKDSLLRTEMKILRAGKLSPLFHKVSVT